MLEHHPDLEATATKLALIAALSSWSTHGGDLPTTPIRREATQARYGAIGDLAFWIRGTRIGAAVVVFQDCERVLGVEIDGLKSVQRAVGIRAATTEWTLANAPIWPPSRRYGYEDEIPDTDEDDFWWLMRLRGLVADPKCSVSLYETKDEACIAHNVCSA